MRRPGLRLHCERDRCSTGPNAVNDPHCQTQDPDSRHQCYLHVRLFAYRQCARFCQLHYRCSPPPLCLGSGDSPSGPTGFTHSEPPRIQTHAMKHKNTSAMRNTSSNQKKAKWPKAKAPKPPHRVYIHTGRVCVLKKDFDCIRDLLKKDFDCIRDLDREVQPVEDISEAFAGLYVLVDPEHSLPDMQGLKITETPL